MTSSSIKKVMVAIAISAVSIVSAHAERAVVTASGDQLAVADFIDISNQGYSVAEDDADFTAIQSQIDALTALVGANESIAQQADTYSARALNQSDQTRQRSLSWNSVINGMTSANASARKRVVEAENRADQAYALAETVVAQADDASNTARLAKASTTSASSFSYTAWLRANDALVQADANYNRFRVEEVNCSNRNGTIYYYFDNQVFATKSCGRG